MRSRSPFLGILAIIISLSSPALSIPQPQLSTRAPSSLALPLSSSDRWIIDANQTRVPYVGINWPGAADVMIPEGLQYASIASIVGRIVETGFNAVRLTFAVEMVDDILDGGNDVTIEIALSQALGSHNGSVVLEGILRNNPNIEANTTRLQVFDAIAAELASQNILLHLDNHVSKGMWCCSLTDGNSWFGDTYFNTTLWIRALAFMASHGRAHWPTFASIGLRNELRPSLTFAQSLKPYTWSTWKTYMTAAADAVHEANPDLLIFFSGLESDLNIEPAVGGSTLLDPAFSFSAAAYPWAGKFVFEMHRYDMNDAISCTLYRSFLSAAGADATTKVGTGSNRAPLVWTEWGHDQSDGSMAYKNAYTACLTQFLVERKIGWMLWVLAGSYYIRSGVQDVDEVYGLLNRDWSGYRGDASLQSLKRIIQQTYAAYDY